VGEKSLPVGTFHVSIAFSGLCVRVVSRYNLALIQTARSYFVLVLILMVMVFMPVNIGGCL
jgi:hypothetical protein